jgi:hypothetical protein
MNRLPLARTANIVVQELGNEVLIYDLKTHKAFNLNETSSIVYKACNGSASFEELKSKYKFTDDIIFLALDELKKQNLIAEDYDSPFAGISRREVIRKVGLASMIALPAIASLVAPTAAGAQSAGLLPLFASCATNAQCASNFCTQGPPRCCVPKTQGIRGANVCCDGTPANCNSQCCSNTGIISPNPACAPFGGPFSIACPNS